MKFFSLVPAFLCLATGAIAAPAPTAADSLVVKRDAYSALQALDTEVKQRRAVIESAVSSMTASSAAAQNATSKATIEQEMQAMTAAFRQTTSAIQADPTNDGLFPLGVLLVGIIDAVVAGGDLIGATDLVDAAMSLVFQLVFDGLLGEGAGALLSLLESILSTGAPDVPVDPRPTPA
ncbi:hypothetical protein Slin15195_G062010 [Septoria linicola]|uniref:Uncharacterized protein n=1 Tax=Septoria linicola TaxID=215465 RepID=A0A9Q9ANR3_9PEZI|nr:hypothetical protein Slin15195_G062010 [Septoria linicola]